MDVSKTKRTTVSGRIYEQLSRRLEKFIEKMTPEEQVEIDGIISIASDDIANSVKTVTFFDLQ